MEDVPYRTPGCRIRRLPAPELRRDPIIERWVVVSTDRLGRPQEVNAAPPTPLESCPFCAGNEAQTPPAVEQINSLESWSIRVVPNTFPALRRSNNPHDTLHHGRHEVVIECPHHEAELARLDRTSLVDLFNIYGRRMRAMREDPRLAYPMVFKNSGADAGASVEHSHSQIIALPVVPMFVQMEMDSCERHFHETSRCLFCDLIHRERSDGRRVVFETKSFIVVAAYAGRFPFECWVLPTTHASHFDRSPTELQDDLGGVMHRLLGKLARGLDCPPYNFYIHSTPLNREPSPSYHWHIEVLPRLNGTAGFEWGTGFAINPIPPEQAAEYLRSID